MQPKERNILVAVDASDDSFEAVRYVGDILPVKNTRITLFHVLSPIPESFWDLELTTGYQYQVIEIHGWEIQQKRMIEDFMEQARRLLMSIGYGEQSINLVTREREVGIARDIAKEALSGYDALVVGRKGTCAVRDLILGSTANKLVSFVSRIPVWVVGDRPASNKILVAMDSSEGARRALEYVGNLFGSEHPELLLLHVGRGVDFLPAYQGISIDEDWLKMAKEQFEKIEKLMESVFKECIRKMEQKGADASRIKTKIVPGVYSRSAAIYEEARHGGYGTIVVGRRGLSRVEEFIMGRVSSKVLQLAQELAVWVVH